MRGGRGREWMGEGERDERGRGKDKERCIEGMKYIIHCGQYHRFNPNNPIGHVILGTASKHAAGVVNMWVTTPHTDDSVEQCFRPPQCNYATANIDFVY